MRALVILTECMSYQPSDGDAAFGSGLRSRQVSYPVEHDGARKLRFLPNLANLAVEPPVPDLVIYLQASVDALQGRIARRGIPYEGMIERSYLERLTDSYARFFHAYDEGPLLIVNASQIDPIHNEADYQQLFQQIESTTGGRHFFNPVAYVHAT